MSYDVELNNDDGSIITLPHSHDDGGTYVLGGANEASLNITYNYSRFYYQHLDEEFGIRWLDGLRAEETRDRLTRAVEALGCERSEDYWEKTPGNAGHALNILLTWAIMFPQGIWSVL